MKLADVVERDPFKRPVQSKLGDNQAFVAAMRDLIGEKADGRLLFSLRASTPLNVIGAKPDGVCVHCNEKTWLSPSSQAELAEHPELVVVCLVCATPALRKAGL